MSSNVLLIDTQLLVLLIVGQTARNFISKHKRLKAYSCEDYDLLISVLGRRSIVTTPNILTEASNLTRQIPEPYQSQISETFAVIAGKLEERYVASRGVVGEAVFLRVGLSDATSVSVGRGSVALLTADLDLYLNAHREGVKAINFNHLRENEGLM